MGKPSDDPKLFANSFASRKAPVTDKICSNLGRCYLCILCTCRCRHPHNKPQTPHSLSSIAR